MADHTYTKDEVNLMLESQAVKIRLDTIDLSILAISKKSDGLLSAVEKLGEDRRTSHESLKTEMNKSFVRKKTLQTYVLGVVAVVTLTTGVITYMGKVANNTAISEITARMDAIIKK